MPVKPDILRDMVIISLQGILTPVEYRVYSANEGLLDIRWTRPELVESGEQDLNDITFKITGIRVMSFHSNLGTAIGEHIIVFKLEDDLEKHA